MELIPGREWRLAVVALLLVAALGAGIASLGTPLTHGTAGGAFLSHTEGGA